MKEELESLWKQENYDPLFDMSFFRENFKDFYF
jgi:hypothetical protein